MANKERPWLEIILGIICVVLLIFASWKFAYGDTIIGISAPYKASDEVLADSPKQAAIIIGASPSASLLSIQSNRSKVLKLGGKIIAEQPVMFWSTEASKDYPGAYIFARCYNPNKPIMDSLDVAINDSTVVKKWLPTGSYYYDPIVALNIAVYSDHIIVTDFYNFKSNYPLNMIRFWFVERKLVQ
jgi:hypothetical protein